MIKESLMLRAMSRVVTALLTSFALLASGIAKAESTTESESDRWRFEITPYFFAAGLSGTTGVDGVKTDVDLSFSDVWDNLDSGYMGFFEAAKDRWFFSFEGIYFKLSDEGTKGWTGPQGRRDASAKLEVTATEIVYQASMGYRVLDKRTKVDVFGAARYTELESDVKLKVSTSGDVFPGGKLKADGSVNWTDPVIGVRVLAPIADNWTFMGVVDVGGFGVNGDIDRTYQGIAGVNWMFKKDFAMKVGYRYFYQNYHDDGVVWDMVAKGPYIGLGIAF